MHAPIRVSERDVKEHTMVGTVGEISLSFEDARWCAGLTECAKDDTL